MENHHPAIVSRETFDAAAAVMEQRGKEKSIVKGSKYQNRYPFSGKIICGECGSSFKRRIHYSTHQKYIAWCCSKHIEQIEDCSMQFIRQDAVEAAFVTMMNKLIYGHKRILRPLRDCLRSMDDAGSYRKVEELENRMDAILERVQVLSGLMTKGYLEPALYGKEKNELERELEELRGKKNAIIRVLNSSLSHAEAVNTLLKFTSKAEMLTIFQEEAFYEYVDRIVVYSRKEVGFELKCGLTLREGLVR
jgi:site-specific DNA recombinase